MPQARTRVHLVADYHRYLRLRDEIARQAGLTAPEQAAAADNRLSLHTAPSLRAPLQTLGEVDWQPGARHETPLLRWRAPQKVAPPPIEGLPRAAAQSRWQLSPSQKRALASVLGLVTQRLRNQPVREEAAAEAVAKNVLAMALNRLAPVFARDQRDQATKLAGWAVTVAIHRLLSLTSGPQQRRRP